MAIYRIFSGTDGESHIEDLKLDEHPELGELMNVSEVRVQEFDGSRHRDFNPLPERRLIIHLSGEVEIGASDGAKRVLRAGDIRLMEDVTGKGHSHNDLTPFCPTDAGQNGRRVGIPEQRPNPSMSCGLAMSSAALQSQDIRFPGRWAKALVSDWDCHAPS